MDAPGTRWSKQMIDLYVEGFRLLWQYEAFAAAFYLLRLLLLLLFVCIGVLAALHALYLLGRQTPLYRKRSPRPGWNKKFIIAWSLLQTLILILFWLAGQLIAQAS